MKFKITNINEINSKAISYDIFEKELIGYAIRDREDLIDNLIDWISEATTDKDAMKEDLKYLISLEAKYILSSISTNEYILEDTDDGQEILEKIYNY